VIAPAGRYGHERRSGPCCAGDAAPVDFPVARGWPKTAIVIDLVLASFAVVMGILAQATAKQKGRPGRAAFSYSQSADQRE
jgi:hypothetical protein